MKDIDGKDNRFLISLDSIIIVNKNPQLNDKNVFDAMRGTQPGGAQQSGGTGGGYSGNTYSTPGYTNQYRRNGNN